MTYFMNYIMTLTGAYFEKRERETKRQRERQTGRQRETERQTNKLSERQQRGKQTDSQTE